MVDPDQSHSECTKTGEDCAQDSLIVQRVKSDSLLHTRVMIASTALDAVVDCGATVTIIADRIYQSLDPKPPTVGRIKLFMAGKGASMEGRKIGPVQISVGGSSYPIRARFFVSSLLANRASTR